MRETVNTQPVIFFFSKNANVSYFQTNIKFDVLNLQM